MKSFLAMLNESLDTPATWDRRAWPEYDTGKEKKGDNLEYLVPFVIEDGKKLYRYGALFTPLSSTEPRYTVMYAIREIEDMKTGETKRFDPIDEIQDSTKRMRFTEGKIGRMVLSTVLSIVKDFIQNINPSHVQAEVMDRHDDRLDSTVSMFRRVLRELGKSDEYEIKTERAFKDFVIVSAERKT